MKTARAKSANDIFSGPPKLRTSLRGASVATLATTPATSAAATVAIGIYPHMLNGPVADAVLATKSWASLEDGTPLVTGEHRGKGVVSLFHVGADMRWSDLPMSGTFVEMLRRTVNLSGLGATPAPSEDARVETLSPTRVLDGTGGFTGRTLFYCSLLGLVITGLIIWITEYYTGTDYRPVKSIAAASVTGHGTNVIQGLAVSLESTALPTIVIVAGIIALGALGSTAQNPPYGSGAAYTIGWFIGMAIFVGVPALGAYLLLTSHKRKAKRQNW